MKEFLKKLDKPSDKYLDTPRMEFEPINSSGGPSEVSRSKVLGGWLIWSFKEGMSNGAGMCFVPDPNHEWKIETPREKGDWK